MPTLTFKTHINRSPAQAFAYMTEAGNWPNVEVGLVDIEPRGRVSMGSRGTQTRSMRGRNIKATWEVVELEANKKIAIAGGGPGMKVRATTSFSPAGGGTDVGFVFDYWPQGLLMKLMSPMIRSTFKKDSTTMMGRMKDAIEKST
jgi:carbon monoxide dehydrogenase subunit G